MIFDIRMDVRFTRKAFYVSGCYTTDTPPFVTYSRVVSRDGIIISFTIAALNDVEIRAADIGNAYLNANFREKIWTVAGTEFGSEKSKVVLLFRALYGVNSYGADWRQILD